MQGEIALTSFDFTSKSDKMANSFAYGLVIIYIAVLFVVNKQAGLTRVRVGACRRFPAAATVHAADAADAAAVVVGLDGIVVAAAPAVVVGLDDIVVAAAPAVAPVDIAVRVAYLVPAAATAPIGIVDVVAVVLHGVVPPAVVPLIVAP